MREMYPQYFAIDSLDTKQSTLTPCASGGGGDIYWY